MLKNKLILVSIFIGILYYYNMKLSIPIQYQNCSFVSNIYTDIFAFIVGLLLVYHGYNNIHNNNLLIIIGIAIITEHILQFSYKV